jgi:hypothetical protein
MSNEKNIIKQNGIKRKILIALITVILIVLMFPKGESIESEVTEGTIWTNDDLIAPFSFPIIKDNEAYQAEVKNAEQSVYPVMKSIPIKSVDSLKAFGKYIISVIDENLKQGTASYLNPTFLSTKAFSRFLAIRKQQKQDYKAKDRSLDYLFNTASQIVEVVSKRGILDFDSGQKVKDSIAIRQGNVDKIEPISKFYFFNEAKSEDKRI